VLIIVGILLLEIYLNGFFGAPRCKHAIEFWGKLWCGISGTYEDYAPYFRQLPSDEDMTAHFQKHRADFERLVQIYREDPKLPRRPGINYDEATPEAGAIMERISIGGMRGDSVVWIPPDPYSVEAQKQNVASDLFTDARLGWPEGRKYSGVLLDGAHEPVIRLNADLTQVFKGYYYTPFVPKIENGRLKKPRGYEWISRTLNGYPSKLAPGDCVCMQFEPQWFIRLCQSLK
jgi:hypothetical protein